MMPISTTRLLLSVIVFTTFTVLLLNSQQTKSASHAEHSSTLRGRQIFASNCAACHGLDGTGTERAPNIVTNPQIQKLSYKELQQIVSDGVPSAGMPGFRTLGASAVGAVTSYIRLMQGRSAATALPGNPKAGEAIFFGKGECSNCHMAAGRGGFLASDLTTYGQTHTAEKIKSAITNPAGQQAKGKVTAIAADGKRYEGMVRNEDNFSLQLQSTTGEFYLLSKPDLKSIERSPTPVMPTDYASRLNEAEVNDLVSYLLSIANSVPRATPHQHEYD